MNTGKQLNFRKWIREINNLLLLFFSLVIKSHKINSKGHAASLYIFFLFYFLRCWLCKYSLKHSSFTSTQKFQTNCSTRSKKFSNTSSFFMHNQHFQDILVILLSLYTSQDPYSILQYIFCVQYN